MHDAPVGQDLPGRYASHEPRLFAKLAASFSTNRVRLSTNHFINQTASVRGQAHEELSADRSLLYDFNLEVDRNRTVKLDRNIERAERLERLGELDVLAIEGQAALLEGFGDVLARDRAVHLAFFTEGASDLHARTFELLGQLLRGRDLFALAGRSGLLELFDAGQIAGRRRHGEAARQQVIAREPRTNLNDFATSAEVVDVGLKQNMHVGSHGSVLSRWW